MLTTVGLNMSHSVRRLVVIYPTGDAAKFLIPSMPKPKACDSLSSLKVEADLRFALCRFPALDVLHETDTGDIGQFAHHLAIVSDIRPTFVMDGNKRIIHRVDTAASRMIRWYALRRRPFGKYIQL